MLQELVDVLASRMQRVAPATNASPDDTSALTFDYVTWEQVHPHPHHHHQQQQSRYCHGTTTSRLTSDNNNNDDDITENYVGACNAIH